MEILPAEPKYRPRTPSIFLLPTALAGFAALLLAGCYRDAVVLRLQDDGQPDSSASMAVSAAGVPEEKFNPRLQRRFSSIHRVIQSQDLNRVRLGRLLFFDPLLSRSGTISCNSCHPLDRYGTTGRRFTVGVEGRPTRRNTPTVYNSSGQFRQFWDGRAASLVEQAELHLTEPSIMDMPPERLVAILGRIPGYREVFSAAFPGQSDPITPHNVAVSLATFEGGLVTPSRWDQYLDGNLTALTTQEQEGAQLFANFGCLGCHTGAQVGGLTFEKVGRFKPWPNLSDHGRSEVTQLPADDMVFKVPSLRNVARTGPWFHDGSSDSLDAAVRKMAMYQLGMYPSDHEVESIVAWLNALTGELPIDYIRAPALPDAARP